MVDFLLRRFVKEYRNTADPRVRQQYGVFSGIVGVAVNLVLFAGKLFAGILAGALSVTADAFNNLSDAASSVATLVGFRLAGQKADAEHPFGHGRIEYLTGLFISVVILLVGFELGRSSVEKILHPEEVAFSLLSGGILLASVGLKLWLSFFQRTVSRRISSASVAASAADSLSDALATSVVFLGLVIGHFTSLRIDGWLGLLIACFILKAGIGAARDTLDPLLGQPPSPELVRGIHEVILRHPQIVGIHDLMIHDYGPGRSVMSVHAEVDARSDLMEAHDIIDHIERELKDTFRLEAVLHMDPVVLDDESVNALKLKTAELAAALDPRITIHDFRRTVGPFHTNLIFDAAAPYDVTLTDEEIRQSLAQKLREIDETYFAVIQIDRSHVN